jgi:threonine/homoserine/homoserine lactone efflux protein
MSAIGVTTGILIHTMAGALGLAVLLKTSAYAFWALKVVGGIYLMYLGYQVIKNKQALEIAGSIGIWLKQRKKIARKIRIED